MRIKSFQWLGFFLASLVLCISIIGGESLDIAGINGIGAGQTLVSVKGPRSHNDQAFFSLDDIAYLTAYDLTFTADSVTEIENQPVVLVGTNGQYPAFNNMSLKSGCFFDDGAVSRADLVVVVDEKLAWDAFKRSDVVGDSLELWAKKFKIMGVVAADRTITGFMSDSGVAHAFIPASTLGSLDKNARISTLQVKNKESCISGENRLDALNILLKLGKSQEDYLIADLAVKNVLIAQKPRILVFLSGLALIIILLQEALRRAKKVRAYLQDRRRSCYWADILRNDAALLARRLIFILLLMVIAVLIWERISFDLYLPPEYLPKDLSDLNFYADLFQKQINEAVLNRGYVTPLLELKLNNLALLSNCLFGSGLLVGLPTVWLSLYLSKWTGDMLHLLITPALTFIAAMTLGAIAILLSGMPLNVNGGDLAVVFSFIYIYSLKLFNQRKGKVSSGEKTLSNDLVDVDGV